MDLHTAVKKGNLDQLRNQVKDSDVKINALTGEMKSRFGCFIYRSIKQDFHMGLNTPLHYAVHYLKGETRNSVVRLLVEHGAHVHQKQGWQISLGAGIQCDQNVDVAPLCRSQTLDEDRATVRRLERLGGPPSYCL